MPPDSTPDFPTSEELAFWDVLASAFDEELDHDASVLRETSPVTPPLPLEERTARFGEAIIRLAKKIPLNAVTERPISQLVGAGTSVGANYCEANDYISTNDFRHRISICRKEAKETRFWLRMIATAEPKLIDEARVLWREATELNLIFGAIWRKTKLKLENRNSRPEA